jgi:hypothetical protein
MDYSDYKDLDKGKLKTFVALKGKFLARPLVEKIIKAVGHDCQIDSEVEGNLAWINYEKETASFEFVMRFKVPFNYAEPFDTFEV